MVQSTINTYITEKWEIQTEIVKKFPKKLLNKRSIDNKKKTWLQI